MLLCVPTSSRQVVRREGPTKVLEDSPGNQQAAVPVDRVEEAWRRGGIGEAHLSAQRYSRSAAGARGSPEGDRRDRPTATAGWTALTVAAVRPFGTCIHTPPPL